MNLLKVIAPKKPKADRSGLLDVQSVPLRVNCGNGTTAFIKVDFAMHRCDQLVVSGWLLGDLDIHLLVGEQVAARLGQRQSRPDVSSHFGLAGNQMHGFAMIAKIQTEPTVVDFAWSDPLTKQTTRTTLRVIQVPPEDGEASAQFDGLTRMIIDSPITPIVAEPEPAIADPGNASMESNSIQAIPAPPRARETRPRVNQITIVGAAGNLNIDMIADSPGDIYALNAAYFHLKKHGVAPKGMITGDHRFLLRQPVDDLAEIRKIVTFSYASELPVIVALPPNVILEAFPCLGRDGFSTDAARGFYHGCSSFFLAVQYAVWKGYRSIRTVGIQFPPPETYTRIGGTTGHPEFVYGVQLANLSCLRKELLASRVRLTCADSDSNLRLFV